MAGDAELRARLTLDQNVDEAVRLASQSLTKMSSDVEKAQAKIAAIIVKGDPLKAIEAQARKEIAAVEKAAAVGGKAAEMAERAKEEILRRASEKRLKLIEKEQEDAKRLIEEQRKVEEKAAAEKAAADRRAADEARRLAEEQAAAARRAAEEERRAAQEAADARVAAQRRVTEILERGEPLRALKRKAREEYDAIRDLERQKLITTQQGEEARAKVLADYSDRRRRIRNGEQDDHIKAAHATRDAVGRLEQPINDIRGMMDSLGVATNSALGQISMLGSDLAATFSSAGPVGVAIAATTALVGGLAYAWIQSREEALKAKTAMVEEFKSANDAIRAQIQAVRDESARRMAKAQGLSDDQIRGQELVGSAGMVVSQREASAAALQAQLDAFDAANRARMASLEKRANTPQGEGAAITLAGLETQRSDIVEKLKEANFQLEEARNNARDAKAAMDQLLSLPNKTPTTAAAKVTATAVGKVSRAKAANDEFDVDAWLQANGMDTSKPFGADIAAQSAEDRTWREFQMGLANRGESPKEIVAQAIKPDEKANDQMAMAGAQWASSFAQGFAAALKAGDAGGILKSVLGGAAAAIASFIPGVGGIVGSGALGLIGGLFRNGGTPYAFDLPQGRNGLAVLPGVNYDAKPAWLHKNEVVMPEEVVNDTFGGLPNAARVAAGGPPPGRAAPRGGDTFVIKSFDSQDALGGIRRALGPAAEFARDVRQSARFFEATAPRALRYA